MPGHRSYSMHDAIPVTCSVTFLAVALAAGTGHAGSAARQLPVSTGDTVQIVRPAPSGFLPVTHPLPFDGSDRGKERRSEGVAVVLDRLLRVAETEGARRRNPPSVSIIDVILIPPYPYCHNGLFGRPLNEPCRPRPGGSILHR